MEPPACTVFDYLCQQNQGHLTAIALSYYGNTISYADLIVNVKKTAAALRAIGMKKGDIATVERAYAAPQRNGFVPGLSVADLLFNEGPASLDYLR